MGSSARQGGVADGLSGLSGLVFSPVDETPAETESQSDKPSEPKTRLEEVKELNMAREKASDETEVAREKHRMRLDQWVGHPVKNHIRVLLCTLPDVLWEGHGLPRVGMDKMMDPKAVKLAYRKYLARFAPDKHMASGD